MVVKMVVPVAASRLLTGFNTHPSGITGALNMGLGWDANLPNN
jgi:hypothetical protein